MKIRIAPISLTALLLASVSSGAAAAPQSHGIHVRAWIDGRSRLVLDDATARWEHFDFAAPGRLECNLGAVEQPTTLDGDVWFPMWPDVPDCENRDCGGCSSSMYFALHQPIPNAELFPHLNVLQARGLCSMVEWPVVENGYRVVVEFNDNDWPGADWYEFELAIADCGAMRYCTPTPNSTGSPAYIGMTGSMSFSRADTVLTVMDAPPGNVGVFFFGRDKAQIPFGNGTLCISPLDHGLYTLRPPVVISRAGQADKLLDFRTLLMGGRIADHSTWSFQFWYRDPQGGGSGTNLSNALRATFCP